MSNSDPETKIKKELLDCESDSMSEDWDMVECPECDSEYSMLGANWTSDFDLECPHCGFRASDVGDFYA